MPTIEWIYKTTSVYLPFPMTPEINGTFPVFQYSHQ